ncbi:MAG: hypothetical protein PHT15_08990 [Gallionellaceae bacterium]|nr:hypothetical protein [Gallionellaceae bacterium]
MASVRVEVLVMMLFQNLPIGHQWRAQQFKILGRNVLQQWFFSAAWHNIKAVLRIQPMH